MRSRHIEAGTRPRKSEPFTIILARGEAIRHVQIGSAGFFSLIGVSIIALTGLFVSVAYMLLHDDMRMDVAARQTNLVHAYEEKISALRQQIDQIKSRQMLDQHLVERQMVELMTRQDILAGRTAQIAPLLRGFRRAFTGGGETVAEPDRQAAASPEPLPFHAGASVLSLADRADIAFDALQRSLEDIEIHQIEQIATASEHAELAADRLSDAMSRAGIDDPDLPRSDVGGPFLPVAEASPAAGFSDMVSRLDNAVDRFDRLRMKAGALPLGRPVSTGRISSRFGIRTDPFLGRKAMHSGMDFSSPAGTSVHASGGGTVVTAGRNGGYGNMVEIRHEDGLVSRYAHLRKIAVKPGQRVERDTIIGSVGSTGRSTGPHLHYEVRRNKAALNPARFLQAGSDISNLL